MKTSNFLRMTALAALAVIALPASANFTTGTLQGDLQYALSGGDNVRLSVCERVATLSGYTNDRMSRSRAEQIVMRHDDIDRVINFVTVSN